MSDTSYELAVPGTGEVVDTSDPVACANALTALRDFEEMVKHAKRELTEAIVAEATRLGVRSFELEDGRRAEVKGGPKVVYDAEEIEIQLRRAGMPEERIREVVQEKVSYEVRAVEAKRASSANPEYARIIERNARVEEAPRYVSVTRRPS